MDLASLGTYFQIGFISLVPILAWLYFFYRQQPEKKSYVVLTFLAGMASVLPIKLYEKYWDTAFMYLQNINLFRHLADVADFQTLPVLLAFVVVSIIVAAVLYIFTAFMMFFLEVLSGDNTMAVYRRKIIKIAETPFLFVSVGMICGVAAYGLSMSVHEKVWFFMVVGMVEEYVKHLVLRFSDEFKIKSVNDAIEFAVIVALGFAFVENIIYFSRSLGEVSFTGYDVIMIIALRSLVSVAAHVCFSGILGYYYGMARFADEEYRARLLAGRGRINQWLHRILHLKGETLLHEERLMEGMLLAVGLHAVFNLLLEFATIPLLVPYICFLFFMVLHLFHRKQYHAPEDIAPADTKPILH